jgi:hypothetical protein
LVKKAEYATHASRHRGGLHGSKAWLSPVVSVGVALFARAHRRVSITCLARSPCASGVSEPQPRLPPTGTLKTCMPARAKPGRKASQQRCDRPFPRWSR